MSLQDIFYIMSIIFMSLLIISFVAFLILLFYLKKRATNLFNSAEEKINNAQKILLQPKLILSLIGSGLMKLVLNQIAQKTKKRTISKK